MSFSLKLSPQAEQDLKAIHEVSPMLSMAAISHIANLADWAAILGEPSKFPYPLFYQVSHFDKPVAGLGECRITALFEYVEHEKAILIAMIGYQVLEL